MGKTAFMFPGQGAQYAGMAKDFYDTVPQSRRIFEQASEELGFSMEELCFEKNDRLDITEYTQAAMLTASMAVLEAVKEKNIKADVYAGLSLGEYGALTAAGVMEFKDAIKVVRQRGILMQDAVPTGLGAMAAVIACDTQIIKEICEKTEGIVTIANYNCPGQIVISGEKQAVEKAGEALKEAGAKRVIILNVSGPFHSPMLVTAGEKLLKVLDTVNIKNPLTPYVCNVDAEYITKKDNIRELLMKQVYSPVKWQQSVENMIKNGVDTFVEIGPGRTLSSFVKKTDSSVKVLNVEKTEDLEKL